MMKKLLILIGISFAIGSCANKNPLFDAELSKQQNTISVSVLDGTAPKGLVPVYLTHPDGSRETATSAANGNLTFSVTGLGEFKVGLDGQQTTKPAEYPITISEGCTGYAVALQLQGAAFILEPAFGQGSTFPWSGKSFTYKLTYHNPSSAQNDLTIDVDPATLPANWTSSAMPSFVEAGNYSTLVVNTSNGTAADSVTLNIRGRVNGTTLLSTPITFYRGWNLIVKMILTQASCVIDFSSSYATYNTKLICDGIDVPFTSVSVKIPTQSQDVGWIYDQNGMWQCDSGIQFRSTDSGWYILPVNSIDGVSIPGTVRISTFSPCGCNSLYGSVAGGGILNFNYVLLFSGGSFSRSKAFTYTSSNALANNMKWFNEPTTTFP